jgi:hypothetical protein
MFVRYVLGAMLAAALLAGCSGVSVNTDYDREADFASYQTFSWVPGNEEAVRNPLLLKRVQKMAEGILVEKGYRRIDDADAADMLVGFSGHSKDKVEVWTNDYYSSPAWWGYRDVDVYQYTEGTLVIDVLDGASDQLVWRGTSTGVIEDPPKDEKILQSLQKVLAKFPPQ